MPVVHNEVIRHPAVRVAAAPASYYLGGIRHEYQDWYNCGPVTTNMVLGYWGTSLSQSYTAHKLRPNPKDVSVTSLEMVTFAKLEYGYSGQVVWGGSMKMLETLLANGLPVIVLQPLRPDSDINHFRVVRGYNRATGTVTVNDSQLGPNLVWSMRYFGNLWGKRSNSLALIYPKAKEALVQTIIKRYGQSDTAASDDSLREARQEVQRAPYDPWTWLRLGQMLYYGERYTESLKAWDRANELGLPAKAMWYAAWPPGLLNEVGRHREAIDLATKGLAATPGSSELYFERARGWDALGNRHLALQNLRMAVEFAPYHPFFREALASYTR